MPIPYAKLVSICLVILLGLGLFVFGLEIVNAKRIVRGVRVAGINLGGFQISKAEKLLETPLEQFQKNGLSINYQNNNWRPSPNELGAKIEISENIKRAFEIGRQKNVLTGLEQQIGALWGRYNLPIDFEVDQSLFDNFIKTQLEVIEKPVKNANIVYDKNKDKFDLIPSQAGLIIDENKLKEDIRKRISFLSAEPIELSLVKNLPKITDEEAEEKYQKISEILKNAPYLLKSQKENWPIDRKMLIDWLSFTAQENTLLITLNQEKIEDYLIALAPSINQSAVNAQLIVKENTADKIAQTEETKIEIIVLSPAKDKIELNIKESALLITQKILNSPTIKQQEIYLVIDSSPAPVTSKNINQLGLTSLLGQGISNFQGSPKNRIHNITIGAAKFNGILIGPGEEFSFNELLGEVGPQQGYLAELVIKKNKTVPEYGGGLCQVSTTLFRAAINSGLKITERYAHSFPVRYYDPQGFDATIYPPHPDLRFINDTNSHVLIQSIIEGSQISFDVFGLGDNRKVEVIGPRIYEKNDDGSMKAVLTQKVYQNGELLREKSFYSNYKSPDLYPVQRNPLE